MSAKPAKTKTYAEQSAEADKINNAPTPKVPRRPHETPDPFAKAPKLDPFKQAKG